MIKTASTGCHGDIEKLRNHETYFGESKAPKFPLSGLFGRKNYEMRSERDIIQEVSGALGPEEAQNIAKKFRPVIKKKLSKKAQKIMLRKLQQKT